MYKDRGDNIDQRTNNINENYMSLRFLHYRNKSINKINKNLNKSKSDKNFVLPNANHIRSYSVANLNAIGPNQAFWEASIYAKFRKVQCPQKTKRSSSPRSGASSSAA